MGAEARCVVEFNGRRGEGLARLETAVLQFRGPFRLDIPLTPPPRVAAAAGRLTIALSDGDAIFELGPQAARWAEKITHPPSLLDKLGVRPNHRVVVLGVSDAAFLSDLQQRAPDISRRRRPNADLVMLQIDTRAGLQRIPHAAQDLSDTGALWIVHPKGGGEPSAHSVLTAGRAAGLVDVKVAAFSTSHTALKFVPRRARR
jgi:hypothetical protein